MPTRRRVVTYHDAELGHGRPRLWAYGYRTIAVLAGCSVRAVRRAANARRFDPLDIVSVAAWVVRRRQLEARRAGR